MNNTTPNTIETPVSPGENRGSEHKISPEEQTIKQQKLFQRYFNKAVQFQSQNNIDLAIELYDKALKYNNHHLPTLQILATLLYEEKFFGRALHYYTRAVDLHAHSAPLHNALGKCYEHCQQWQQARAHYLDAIELRQNYAEALNNFGNICRKLGDYQQAEYGLLRSLRLCISVPTLISLGVLMTELRNYTQAHSFFDHALRIQPFNNQIKWHKALLLLTEGEFKQGWELYTRNSADKEANGYFREALSDMNPADDKPLSFENKTIHIYGKQSINDEVMFASCFPEVIQQAKKCYIECDERLVSIFKRSFPAADIIAKSEYGQNKSFNQLEDIEITLSMVDVIRNLRQSFSDFPLQHGYLNSSATSNQRWLQCYMNLGCHSSYHSQNNYQNNSKYVTQYKNGLKIGIAWLTNDSQETMNNSNALHHWEAIFVNTHSQLINLQCGQIQKELDEFGQQIHDWPESDHQHNLEQLAAQISALDLIITASNLVAHMAGALGKPVWIILPYAANWRWFNGKQPCPWYGSARIFRQKTPDDWTSLFEKINQDLLALQNEGQITSSQRKLAAAG